MIKMTSSSITRKTGSYRSCSKSSHKFTSWFSFLSTILPLQVTIFSMILNVSSGLRILMLDVPSPTTVGESVELTCSYELEGDKLYSVKWYKNDVEFFRYVPKDWPPGQFLPIVGIKVDLSRSNKRSVYLKHLDLNSEGVYRCEVSAEAPSFNTAEMEKEMKVYMLPTEGPQIYLTRSKNKVGDVVTINCTSSKSKPAANLKWFINDHFIDPEKNDDDYDLISSTEKDSKGLEVSSLAMKFLVKEKHFVNGIMRMKCTAIVARMYQMSKESIESIEPDDDSSFHPSSSSSGSSSGRDRILKMSENLSQVGANGPTGNGNSAALGRRGGRGMSWIVIQGNHWFPVLDILIPLLLLSSYYATMVSGSKF